MDLLIPGLDDGNVTVPSIHIQLDESGNAADVQNGNIEVNMNEQLSQEPTSQVAPYINQGIPDAEEAPLVDFSDEQMIQVPAALLMTAEMDDTFGIFNMQAKPKSYSTPNCIKNRLQNCSKTSSTTSWDSPSFLANINLNDGFLKGSASACDFTVWADNPSCHAETTNNSVTNEGEAANAGGRDGVDSTGSEGPPQAAESVNDDGQTQAVRVEDNSAFMSPIPRLEGSSEHEDKTSIDAFDDSTESDILDINDLSVFAADDADISDYGELRDPNVQRMHFDFSETNQEGNVEVEGELSPKTPSPTSVLLRTPAAAARARSIQQQQRPVATELGSSFSLSPHLQKSSVPVEPGVALSTDSAEEDYGNVHAPTPPIPITPTSPGKSRSLSALSYAVESPKKHSPFPTLESILKNVDDMFSNIDYVDPERLKKRKARERLSSLPATLPDTDESKLNKKANASLGSGVNGCSNSTYVASTSVSSEVEALDETRTINTAVLPAPTTPESKNNHEIGTPFKTPTSNKYRPTPTTSKSSLSRGRVSSRVIAPIPRLSFSSSSSSGSDSSKKLSLSKPIVFINKPASKGRISLSARGGGSEAVPSLKINPSQKQKPLTLQPMKATMAMTSSTATFTTAPAPVARTNVCASAPVSRKFIPPIAASSPKPAGQGGTSRPGTIPSPARKSLTVKSSGYGQQSLNQSRSSLNTSRTSLNTSIPTVPPPSSTQIPARVSLPSPRVIPAPRAMPSPIKTRISNLQQPSGTSGAETRRSVSIDDIPAKITEISQTVSEIAKQESVSKNKENKPKLLQRFGFKK